MIPTRHRSQLTMQDASDPRGCQFCDERPAHALHAVMQQGGKRWSVVISLCYAHRRILAVAGERGRVHKGTGVRYWLVEGG